MSEKIAGKVSGPQVRSCQFGPWKITTTKSHIMESKCSTPEQCSQHRREADDQSTALCDLCRYSRVLGGRPLPAMVFSGNSLRLEHAGGGGVEVTALAALQGIADTQDDETIQVAHAKEWRQAREACPHSKVVVGGQHDWTHSCRYSGTLVGGAVVEPSDEQIDMEKLRTKEPILFYEELYLYEDELDDNGASNCVVKIRVMSSGFLVLVRHYLRVDHVLLRLRETRLYHAAHSAHIVRERVTRTHTMRDWQVPATVYRCADAVSPLLPITERIIDKLVLPQPLEPQPLIPAITATEITSATSTATSSATSSAQSSAICSAISNAQSSEICSETYSAASSATFSATSSATSSATTTPAITTTATPTIITTATATITIAR